MVSRICEMLLLGVCDWTLRACTSCSSVTCPRSSRSCSTVLRALAAAGAHSSSDGGASITALSSASSEFVRLPNMIPLFLPRQLKAVRPVLHHHRRLRDLFDGEAVQGLAFTVEHVVDH